MAKKIEFLYVAQEASAPGNEFKVGKTTVRPSTRAKKLPGQTDCVFTMRHVLVTQCCDLAEKFAFVELDALGLRKYPGTKKELFICPLETLTSVCKRAVVLADKAYVLRGLDKLEESLALRNKRKVKVALTGSNKFWRTLVEAPVESYARKSSLLELLQSALQGGSAERRAAQLGIVIKAQRESKVEFEIAWPKATEVLEWLKIKNLPVPQELTTRFQLSHA